MKNPETKTSWKSTVANCDKNVISLSFGIGNVCYLDELRSLKEGKKPEDEAK